jgi:prevent-host-death family protein
MSEHVGIRALRQQVSVVLKRVAEGEVITVSDRGRPVARIVPLNGSTMDQLVAEGRATGAEGSLLVVGAELGLPVPSTGGMPPTQALADLRSDER